MEFEIEIEGKKVKAKVDTGFDGEVIVSKEVFDSIPGEAARGPAVCTAAMECYTTFVKLARVVFLGKDLIAKVVYSPVIEKNLVGEALLRKAKAVVSYKSERVEDP